MHQSSIQKNDGNYLKSVDKTLFLYYTIIVKRGNQEMKQMKKANGKEISYNFRNEEMARNLRKLGHKVVEDKKKKANKEACRKGW